MRIYLLTARALCTSLTDARIHPPRARARQEPFTLIKPKVLRRVLTAMCIPDFHPVLVHCINGQQTTGCVVGCLRKAQGWALSAVFEEYRRHISGSKVRALDLQVIELCDEQPDAELLAADALDGGGKEARKKAKGAAGGGKTGAGGDGDPEAPAADRPREQMSAPAVAQAGGEERAAPVAVPAASLPASPIKTGSPTLGQPLLSSAATSPLSVTRSRSMPAPDN